MKSILTRKVIASAMLVLTLAGTGAAAQAQVTPAIEGPSDSTSGVGVNAVRDCDGGAQEASLVRTDNSGIEIGETFPFVPLPNTLRTFTTPAGDTDQVRISFTAETALFGAPFDTAPGGTDGVGIAIRLDGVDLPSPADLHFASIPFHASATLVCQRVGPGVHTVEVYWGVIDAKGNNTLTGRIDDWSLDIEINN